MTFNPRKPITAGNCPTRAALERSVADLGFRKESIHARHTEKKKLQHLKNVQERGQRKHVKPAKVGA